MFSSSGPADVANLFALFIGAVLLLRKVAQFEGHHLARVLVLTVVFSVPVVLFFLGCLSMLTGAYGTCMPVE